MAEDHDIKEMHGIFGITILNKDSIMSQKWGKSLLHWAFPRSKQNRFLRSTSSPGKRGKRTSSLYTERLFVDPTPL